MPAFIINGVMLILSGHISCWSGGGGDGGMCVCVCVCVYIYIEREKEWETLYYWLIDTSLLWVTVVVGVNWYAYAELHVAIRKPECGHFWEMLTYLSQLTLNSQQSAVKLCHPRICLALVTYWVLLLHNVIVVLWPTKQTLYQTVIFSP